MENTFAEKNKSIPYRRVEPARLSTNKKKNMKFLVGGLSNAIDEIIAASFCALGYNTSALPIPRNESMQRGKEFCDSGLCSPTYFVVGNLLHYLENLRKEGLSAQEIVENYAFFFASSCGPCRFGMYEYQYQNALEKAGYHGFRMILINSTGEGMESSSDDVGIKMDLEFYRTILNAVMVGDILNAMRYRVQPYEVNAGETEKVYKECKSIVIEHLSRKTPLRKLESKLTRKLLKSGLGDIIVNLIDQKKSGEIKTALEICKQKIANIKVDYMNPKPVVKITGEFWAALTEGDGNYQMFSYLHEEGCEIIVEPVSTWISYLLWLSKSLEKEKFISPGNNGDNKFSVLNPISIIKKKWRFQVSRLQIDFADWYYRRYYSRFSDWMGGFVRKTPSIEYLAKIGDKYMDRLYDSGEGFLEVAKNIYYTKNRLAHMVLSIKPFGCMPSTISDAIQAKVVEDFDNMVFLPVETSGEGKINALSRVQMALGEAREKMRDELEAVLGEFDYTLDDWNKLKESMSNPISAIEKFPEKKGHAMNFSHYFYWTMNGKKGKIL
ncbi:MAG: hypothetical protein ABUK01_06620 [Leptospirales bacterium]